MPKHIFSEKVKSINELIRRRSLKNSVKDGAAFSVMDSFGQTYLSAFAVALKATNTHLALLSSLPKLISSFLQVFSADLLQKLKNRKKLVARGVFFQALIWLPMFILPMLFKSYSMFFLIIFACLYMVMGDFVAPAWNSWMGDLVKENERGIYFGFRNKVTGSVAFFAVIIAGLLLNLFEHINVWVGFGLLFFVAFIARTISYKYIKKMHEPRYTPKQKDYFNFASFIVKLKHTNYGRFVIYLTLFKFSVGISSPFYAAYMLRDLGFSYFKLMAVFAAASLATFLTMLYWGRHSDIFGNKKIMVITGIVTTTVPWFWIFNKSVFYLVFIQIIAGFAWAGFNLSTANFLFDNVSRTKRVRCFAYQTLLVGVAVFVGSMFGGFIANLPKFSFIFSSFYYVFFLSGLGRLIATLIYLPRLKEKRLVRPSDTKDLFVKLVAVRPISGMIFETSESIQKIYKKTGIKKKQPKIDWEHDRKIGRYKS